MTEEIKTETPVEETPKTEIKTEETPNVKDEEIKEETTDTNDSEDKKEIEETKEDDKIEEKEEDLIEYTDFEIPKDMEVNKDLLSSFSEKAKALKLNQAQAQDLINTYTDAISKQISDMSENFDNTRKEWDKEMKDDKEFGGINFDAKAKVSQNALDKLDKYNIKKTLKEYGLDKHPAIVKTFHLIGKNFIEDNEIIKGDSIKEQTKTSGGNPLLAFKM